MQLVAWFRPKPHRYDLVRDDRDDHASPAPTVQATGSSWRWLLQTALVCLLVAASFLAGRMTTTTTTTTENSIGLERTDKLFVYNRTFGEPPSDTTNAAWESLFPKHGGFFVHPQLAPKRSAFSIFHQMHCLDELRHGFYVLHDQVISYSKLTSEQTAEKRALPEHSLGHIRHCIDLLRQSLMCNADLTVELKDEKLGGVTGFGTKHRCVEWRGLLEWIRPWEETDAPPLAEVSHHDHAGT